MKTELKKKQNIKVGKVEFKLLFPDLLPEQSPEEYHNLLSDIAVNGVQIPIVTDDKRGIIDGKNRAIAAAERKLKNIPFIIVHNLTEQQKKQLAIKLNAQRRHITKKARLTLAIELRKSGLSYRQIAEIINVSYETVRRHLATVTNVTDEFPDKVKGKDGRDRPANAKSKPPHRTVAKNITEAERVFAVKGNIKSEDLPNTITDVNRIERIARESEKKKLREQRHEDVKLGEVKLLAGDFRKKGKGIPDNSVDLLFTDPPYAKQFLPLWLDLAELAVRVLKPGGLLVTYSGILYLPQIYQMLAKHLEYFWTCSIYHSGGKKLVPAVKIHQAWKPVLVYHKPPLNKYWKPFTDMVTGGKSKKKHEWEQAEDEAIHYIKALCPKNGTLLDCMMGSGTSIVAGLKCGVKKCIGIEIDGHAYTTAEKRVKEVIEELKNDVA